MGADELLRPHHLSHALCILLHSLGFASAHTFQPVRPPMAAWRRLVLHFDELSVLRRAGEQPTPRTPTFLGVGPALRARVLAAALSKPHAYLDFDGTLGFPGRGGASSA